MLKPFSTMTVKEFFLSIAFLAAVMFFAAKEAFLVVFSREKQDQDG